MMAKSRCESVTRYIIPAVRGLIAKSLVEKYGFSQSDAARMLGITQAAVSYYISSKRGSKVSKKLEENSMVMEIIMSMTKKIAETKGSEKADIDLCEICKILDDYVNF
ncbi:MAG: XRE family transcriptional regulator [Nitrososphaeria archaeon]|nr:XRE family transcriptional regulator [Nitrososphaeria archaeon]